MKVVFFISLRYLSGRKEKGIFSFFSIMSIIGIILGVAALISVISVMNGFQENIKEKTISLQSFHLSIHSFDPRGFYYEDLLKNLKEIQHISGIYPFIETAVLFSIDGYTNGTLLRGYEKSFFSSDTFKSNTIITDGSYNELDSNSFIAVGDQFALLYGAKVNSKIILTVFTDSVFQPKIKLFTVKAHYKTGYYPIDSSILYTTLENIQQMMSMQDKCTAIGITVDNLKNVQKVKNEIINRVPFSKVYVNTWFEENQNTYNALKNEKTLMFFIVFMIIIVSSFYIISSQVMTVMNKQKEIGILKAIGFTPQDINNIFLLNGIIIGLLGVLLGTSLGFIIALNLDNIFNFIENFVNGIISILFFFINFFNSSAIAPKFQIFSRDIYYFDKVPVSIRLHEVILINILTFILVFVSSLIPAKKAASVKPKEVIHNE
ncbi:MAG: ABC transporter permease [Exilispira sp.]